MMVPHLNCFGRALPVAWQQAIVRRARGLDLAAIVSDLFLDYPPNDRGFDPVTTKRQFFTIEQIVARYFRATTLGAENVPDGRVVMIASHSGVIPWDAILLVAEIYRLTGRFSWNAGHEFWGRYASLKDLLVPTGMVLGGRDEFEELLRRNETFTAGQHAEPAGESRYRGWRVVLNRFVWRAHIFTVGSLVVWAEINARCSNSLSLKGLDLPAALRATRSMEEATREADVAGTKAAIVGWRI